MGLIIKAREESRLKTLFAAAAVSLMILLSLPLCRNVYGQDNPSSQGETPYFSNKDLEQYKMSPGNKTPDVRVNGAGTKEGSKEKIERKEREYWCKKATSYEKKIERGRSEISDMEKELSSEDPGRKNKIALGKKVAKTRKQVANLEKDLSDLEDEAHRKNIPPGWLRCQYE